MKKRGYASSLRWLVFAFGLATGTAWAAWGQVQPGAADVAATPAGAPVTVTGVVLNAATGEPLRRALVKVFGGPERGALTDGEGRFEIHGVPPGVRNFQVLKPGFREEMESETAGVSEHSVSVESGMPSLSFSITPENAISGHVTLSTGAPALGIELRLVRQIIVDGRPAWEMGEQRMTTPDGYFRFAGLADGTYLLWTKPEFDSSHATEPRCNADSPAEITGYASEFYGGAPELSGAARIVIAGGQTAEVNLALNQTSFHMVQVSLPRAPDGASWEFTQTLVDHSGQELDYPIHREKDHSLCVYLPDGSYTLLARASIEGDEESPAPGKQKGPKDLLGLIEFSVDGRPTQVLKVALTQAPSSTVHLHYEPAPPAAIKASNQTDEREEERGDAEPLQISLVRADVIAQRGTTQVQGTQTGESTYELAAAPPGPYWIQASADRTGVCAGAVTAGGQNLARTPWVAGPSGEGMPIEVVLRTDCGKLTVQMPGTLSASDAGEGSNLHVYVVPEFDSIEGVYQNEVRQFGEHTATFEDMVPGAYRVFAFRTARSIEFRNPAALSRLGPGQRVAIEPGGSANLVLEGVSR